MKKNLFLTFCFSFIPGAGQMYQGYMKRGLSVMILFAAFCALSVMVATPILAMPLPIIFIYSFFDTYNIRNKKEDDLEPVNEYIWQNWHLEKYFNSLQGSNKSKLIGSGLIILGIYLVLNIILRDIAYGLGIYQLNFIVNIITDYLGTIIIAATCIGIGIRIINKNK